MRRIAVVTLAVAAVACSGRTAVGVDDAESTAAETNAESSNDTQTETSGASEPDLPADPPEWCENGVDVLNPCSSDNNGFTCYEKPSDVGVPMCDELVSGPSLLGLSKGLAACGCEAIGSLYLRDLDGDGADELLATCSSPEAVFVWRGRADGLLSCADVYPVDYPHAMWFVDYDEDGLDDLITTMPFWETTMSVLRATQPGVFEPGQPLDAGVDTDLSSTLEFDVDGDGRHEQLATHIIDDPYAYGPLITWTAEAGEVSIALDRFGDLVAANLTRSDVDGDGWDDLIGAAEQSWWMRGSADGLGMPEPFDGGADYFRISLGDIDGDQLVDLLASSDPPSYRLGAGDGTFGVPMSPGDTYEDFSYGVELAQDLDGDGRVELVIWRGDSFDVWRSSPSGPIFDSRMNLQSTIMYAAGDVDGDGRGDLVTATGLSGATNSQITRWRASP